MARATMLATAAALTVVPADGIEPVTVEPAAARLYTETTVRPLRKLRDYVATTGAGVRAVCQPGDRAVGHSVRTEPAGALTVSQHPTGDDRVAVYAVPVVGGATPRAARVALVVVCARALALVALVALGLLGSTTAAGADPGAPRNCERSSTETGKGLVKNCPTPTPTPEPEPEPEPEVPTYSVETSALLRHQAGTGSLRVSCDSGDRVASYTVTMIPLGVMIASPSNMSTTPDTEVLITFRAEPVPWAMETTATLTVVCSDLDPLRAVA